MASLASPIGPTIDVVARTVSRSAISGGGATVVQSQNLERDLEIVKTENTQQTQEISGLLGTVNNLKSEVEKVKRGGALVAQLRASLVNVERNLEIKTQEISTLRGTIGSLKTEVENSKKSSALAIRPQASLVNVERNLEIQTTQNAQQTQEISTLRGTIGSLKTEVENSKKSSALAIRPQASLVNVERNLALQSTQNAQQTQEISRLLGTIDSLKTEVENVRRSGALVVQLQSSLVNVERNLALQSTQNVQQTQEISALKKTVDVLRTETTTLNTGLASISNLVQQDSALEKQQELQEAERERKLAETKIRMGKESQLEQKITNALVNPVKALQQKVTNIFGRIGEALTALFAGWLTNKGIEALKAASEGNKEKLEEIKDNVLKHIGYAVGAFAAIKIGFDLIIKTITGLAGKIGGLVLKLAKAPLNLIRKGLQAIPIIGPRFGGPKPPAGPGTKPPAGPGAKPPGGGGMLGAAKNFARNMGLPLLTGTALTGLDIAQGEDPGRAIAGATTGMIGSAGAFALGSLIPIPGSGVVTGALSYEPSANFGKEMYDKFFGNQETSPTNVTPTTPMTGSPKPEPPPTIVGPAEADAKISQPQSPAEPQNSMMSQPTSPAPTQAQPQTPAEPQNSMLSQPTSPAPTQAQPQTPAIPPPSPEMVKNFEMAWKYKDNSMFRGRIESAWDKMTVEQQQQAKSWAKSTGKDWTQMKLIEKPPAAQTSSLPSAQIQPLPKPTQNVGELTEPAPNVIMMPSSQSNTQQSSMSRAPTNGTDTPLISSSNPDNFYVLYSQLNYNVVV